VPDTEAGGHRGLAAAAIVAATLAVYASSLGASFQFDDFNVVVSDPRVQSLRAWWGAMPGIRPLLKASYALNHSSGLGAAGFRGVNVLVHAACALLVGALLARLARRHGLAEGRARVASLVGALLFALHPVQTEAVTYVCGRSTSLAALFSLGSVLAWIEGRERGRLVLSHGVSPLLFALALGVKETAAVVPLAIVLWLLTDTRRPFRFRDAFAATAVHGAVLLVAAAAALASPAYRHLAATSLAVRGIGENLLTQAGGVTYLAGQLVRLDRLNADPLLPVVSAWSPAAALEAAVLVALVALAFLASRRRPALAFGVLWFFLWLAPTNSVLPRLDVANDRQLYVASIGPAWLLAWGLSRVAWRRRTVLVILTGVVLVLGAATIRRNAVYANEIVFWEDVARKTPANGRALNNLGYAYALAGRRADAESALRRALSLDPSDVRAAVNLKLLLDGSLK
jgi:protein O-mannosyl-transferase